MLQSINPRIEEITKRHSFIDSVSQIENLPRKKTPNGAVRAGTGSQPTLKKSPKTTQYDVTIPNGGVRRPHQAKDEDLETKTDGDEPISPVEKQTFGSVRRTSKTVFTGKMEVLQERDDSSARSVSTEKGISDTTSSPCDTVIDLPRVQLQSNLHAGLPAESFKPNSPVDKEDNAISIDIMDSERIQKPAVSFSNLVY